MAEQQLQEELMLPKSFTYGAEFELADIDIRKGCPEGTHFTGDPDVCNSNGLAADPDQKDCFFGAEVNTRCCHSIPEIMHVTRGIFEHFPEANVNHRCVLHLHIGWDNLKNDLNAMKKILSYTNENGEWFIKNRWKYTVTPEMDSNTKSFFTFDTKIMPEWRYDFCMAANTVQEFREGHAKVKDGRVLWQTTKRYAVNMYTIFEHNAIEFRCFFPTTNLQHIENGFHVITEWVRQALTDRYPVAEWVGFYPLATECPYDHDLEKKWLLSNYKFNDRDVANANRKLILEGKLPKKEEGSLSDFMGD